ncbi:hypothetical protein BD779DRAFT_1466031 [Infundibulicybe gibba]|nr:hypothetical protein BD779DRAFT_1466031 [Infundibulicybe gibba]
MSRIPQPTSIRSPKKTPGTPTASRVGTKSLPARSGTPTKAPKQTLESPNPAPQTSLSIKEAIALKRAEARKAQAKPTGGGGFQSFGDLEDALPTPAEPVPDEDILGRLSLRDTIERGRSTGSVNIATRSLPCIPSALFEIHLGLTPDKLKSVPDEPPLPPATAQGGRKRDTPAWFEAQDLQVLKAWNNDIIEIQHEISLFGSLKFLDASRILIPLTTLDLSHNALSSLPENIFALPELTTLNISHNALTSLPFNAPFRSNNPRRNNSTGGSFFTPKVTRASTPLPHLLTLDASHNQIIASNIDTALPKSLAKFDLSANPIGQVTSATQSLLRALGAAQKLTHLLFVNAEIQDDAFVRLLVGKQILREAWEVELERGTRARGARSIEQDRPAEPGAPKAPSKPVVKEPVVKEAWEIDAEQGLLTEGGKRRARAAAAASAASSKSSQSALGVGAPPTAQVPSSSSNASTLASPQYFSQTSQTLTLPASTPQPKDPHTVGHSRWPGRTTDLGVPTPTVPLSLIVTQPFAQTLKVLALVNRRADRSFALPPFPDGFEAVLPHLEELNLEGCGIGDLVTVTRSDPAAGASTPPRTSEPLLPLIAKLFPSLRTLNLAYNALTSTSLTTDALDTLLLASPERRGLKHLHLRGNRLSTLDGLVGVAEAFKGNREVPSWKLDELDLRDNEIGKLPAELGLLPLDVFLVDGNIFRVPQRRVWEREGTKGLLSWLRGRIE